MPGFGSPDWEGGLGGGSVGWGAEPAHIPPSLARGILLSFPRHSVSCSPESTGSRGSGTQIRVTLGRLRGQISRQAAQMREASDRGVRLQMGGLGEDRNCCLLRGPRGMAWTPWQRPELQDPLSRSSHPQAIKVGSAFQP